MVLYETLKGSTPSASEYDSYNLTSKLITVLSDDLFQLLLQPKSIFSLPRHSSKFPTRLGHVQLERDYDSAYACGFSLSCSKISKKRATRYDPIPEQHPWPTPGVCIVLY